MAKGPARRAADLEAGAIRGHADPVAAAPLPSAPGPAAGSDREAGGSGVFAAGEFDWSDRGLDLALLAGDGLLIELGGVDAAELAGVLNRLGSDVGLGDRLAVCFTADQLEPVAAALLGTGVQLLCEPTMEERAAALLLARAAAGGGVAENERTEARRLAAIAAEIARIADALAGTARPAPAPGPGQPSAAELDADPAVSPVSAPQVRGAIRSRRLRDAMFGANWFEEPAWDMLLDLYAAEMEGVRVSVSSLCIAAAVAQTTALRWISKMIAADLLAREDDVADRRRAFITLTSRAGEGLRRYFATLQRAGLGIA